MIARVWRGVVAADRAPEYVTYVEATGVAEYRRTPGCQAAWILTRDVEPQRVEVTAFSLWQSNDHIRAFAGDDIEAMVLYPEDEDFLLEQPTLTHHHVVDPPAEG